MAGPWVSSASVVLRVRDDDDAPAPAVLDQCVHRRERHDGGRLARHGTILERHAKADAPASRASCESARRAAIGRPWLEPGGRNRVRHGPVVGAPSELASSGGSFRCAM